MTTNRLLDQAQEWASGFPPLTATVRGPLIENVHHGAIAIVRSDGSLLGAIGSPNAAVFIRSSAKPLQVIPLVESGAAERYGFSPAELAVMAGSHDGGVEHVAAVRSILRRIGLDESDLRCGAQWPLSREAANDLIRMGAKPDPIHNNCSGKHAAMLALVCHRGCSIDGYYLPDHPVQLAILDAVAGMSGTPASEIAIGVDGCGVPVFGLPLRAAALAFARLVDPGDLPPARRNACQTIVSAMLRHPEMVAGEGRICTALMRACPGRIVAKSGAEGYYALGILHREPARPARGIGIALKIADGNFSEGVYPVAIEIVRQYGLADAGGLALLEKSFPTAIRNARGKTVGDTHTLFQLPLLE